MSLTFVNLADILVEAPKGASARPTQEQLDAAFKRVSPKPHWKARINATIDVAGDADVALIEDAIVHFTGSIANVTRFKNGRARFTAAGYWSAIGS
jgi:hypothetical protein